MAVTYTCPNPSCGASLKTAGPIPAGRKVKCPKCEEGFVPVPEAVAAPGAATAPRAEAGPGTFKFAADAPAGGKKGAPNAAAFKFADDAKKKPAAPKAEAPKADGAKPAPPPPPPPKSKYDDDEEDAESIKRGYGIAQESDEEKMKAEQAKVKFGDVSDKYKKSARGPAVGLLVMPANLMTAAGLVTAVAGLLFFTIGIWPLVFNDAPPSDEEVEEAIMTMFMGFLVFGWGGFVCFGASQMSELSSYMWAMAGAIMAVPLLVGIYAVVMLQDPKVKEGFAETEGGPEDEGEKDEDEDDEDKDEDEDEDDEDEDEDEKPRKRRR
ncbi:MAG TPA: hypothetical protein VH092_35015 [Urbifossiella sp.]|nr:hypothetical protein [Urbifossiella sp.]